MNLTLPAHDEDELERLFRAATSPGIPGVPFASMDRDIAWKLLLGKLAWRQGELLRITVRGVMVLCRLDALGFQQAMIKTLRDACASQRAAEQAHRMGGERWQWRVSLFEGSQYYDASLPFLRVLEAPDGAAELKPNRWFLVDFDKLRDVYKQIAWGATGRGRDCCSLREAILLYEYGQREFGVIVGHGFAVPGKYSLAGSRIRALELIGCNLPDFDISRCEIGELRLEDGCDLSRCAAEGLIVKSLQISCCTLSESLSRFLVPPAPPPLLEAEELRPEHVIFSCNGRSVIASGVAAFMVAILVENPGQQFHVLELEVMAEARRRASPQACGDADLSRSIASASIKVDSDVFERLIDLDPYTAGLAERLSQLPHDLSRRVAAATRWVVERRGTKHSRGAVLEALAVFATSFDHEFGADAVRPGVKSVCSALRRVRDHLADEFPNVAEALELGEYVCLRQPESAIGPAPEAPEPMTRTACP